MCHVCLCIITINIWWWWRRRWWWWSAATHNNNDLELEYSIPKIAVLYKFEAQKTRIKVIWIQFPPLEKKHIEKRCLCGLVSLPVRCKASSKNFFVVVVVNSLINVYRRRKKWHFVEVFIHHFTYTQKKNECERATNYRSITEQKTNHGSTCHFGTFSKFFSVRVCFSLSRSPCVCY